MRSIKTVMQAAFLGYVLPRQLCYKATLQLVRASVENLRLAARRRLDLRRAYLLAGIAHVRLPHRPGRVEPRDVKRRTMTMAFLTQPHNVVKTALMKQQQALHADDLS